MPESLKNKLLLLTRPLKHIVFEKQGRILSI